MDLPSACVRRRQTRLATRPSSNMRWIWWGEVLSTISALSRRTPHFFRQDGRHSIANKRKKNILFADDCKRYSSLRGGADHPHRTASPAAGHPQAGRSTNITQRHPKGLYTLSYKPGSKKSHPIGMAIRQVSGDAPIDRPTDRRRDETRRAIRRQTCRQTAITRV